MHNNRSAAKKKNTKDREIADKTVSNNSSNESKSAKKKVCMFLSCHVRVSE